MSDERHETIDDIVKEIRGNAEHNHALVEVSKYLTEIADRIEAAEKREREAGAEAVQIVGEIGEMVGRETARHKPVTDCHGLNAAAMLETLLRCDAMAQMPEIREYTIVKEMRNLIKKSALSAPPRNCDVGTAEEQEKRFHSFCRTHLSGTRSICSEQCPCVGCRSMFHCLTKWAQMPYEAVKG